MAGADALDAATRLLRRARLAHPTAGLWEAADLQWWWGVPRPSDQVAQAFWFDAQGPLAAIVLTAWPDAWTCDPLIVPGAPDATVAEVWTRALASIGALDVPRAEVPVRDDDRRFGTFLRAAGFVPTGHHDGTTWLAAEERPAVPALPEGFRILDRTARLVPPHHLARRNGPGVEARLRQTTLYDPELDLAVEAPGGEVAAYGLFWFDPVTRVGLVEPMRTEDPFQRRGLARTLLASGLERLARRGAARLKVSYVSAAARDLYRGAGFRLESTATTYARPARR